MLNIVKRIIKLSKLHKWRIQLSLVLAFFEGIFIIGPEMLVIFSVYKIAKGQMNMEVIKFITILLISSVVLRAIFRRLIDGLQSGTGYEIFADERMKIGDHLKKLPMGFFTGGKIGDVTSVVTTDILFVEMYGMATLSKIVNAYINMVIGSLMMLYFDWRIGIIAIITFVIATKSLKKIDMLSKVHSEKRQTQMGELVGTVIEFVKGIGVIKAFNLKGNQMKKVDKIFRDTRDCAINFEREFAAGFVRFHSWFALGVGSLVMMSSSLVIYGQIDYKFGIIIMIYAINFFAPYQVLSTVSAIARIMEASLDRYDAVMNEAVIDKDGVDIDLINFDIEFKDVSFAYENENVLKNISFKVKENSMTALVGKSGCGKTTITNLIARFWDTQEGQIFMGGIDIKKMTCNSLLKNISVVFQEVYLFNDTLLNNIKFGKSDASFEEVIEVCKKARCYDFIMELKDGFETIVDEGGSSLSGGEKQRISIARAILKDAPIILLDEATASVDPDNEKYIQEAISELIKNKTLVVIAHKLRTIRYADRIIVLDKGKIIEQGDHNSLMDNKGLYKELWDRRTIAKKWVISDSLTVQ